METIAKKETFEKTFDPPEGMIGILVEGNCLEPAIRDGQMVFVTRHMGNAIDIARGTPVVVDIEPKPLVKLWHGVRGSEIILRYLNGTDGRPGYISVRNDEIINIWIVRGIWFGDTPFIAEPTRRFPPFRVLTDANMLAALERGAERDRKQMEHNRAAAAIADAHTLPEPKQSPASKEKTTGKKPSAKKAGLGRGLESLISPASKPSGKGKPKASA